MLTALIYRRIDGVENAADQDGPPYQFGAMAARDVFDLAES
jgi:hypothetical protein